MEWFDIFNKGIPYDRAIGFTLDVIVDNCATDEKKCLRSFSEELLELNEILDKKYQLPFMLQKGLFSVLLDESLEQYMTFSPQILIFSMLEMLDYKVTFNDDYQENKMIEIARKKLKELSRVKYSSQLEKDFPKLFSVYKDIEHIQKRKSEMIKNYNFAKKLGLDDEAGFKESYEGFKEILSFYGFEKTTLNAKTFVENMVRKYNKILKPEVYNEITAEIASTQIEMHKLDDSIDKKKFSLLMACAAMNNCFLYPDAAIANISYLAQFFRENEDNMNDPMTVDMYMNDEALTLNIKDLYKIYKEFLIQHPEVKIVRKSLKDFEGKTFEDIEAYLKQFEGELSVSWDILPSGESLFERVKSNTNSLTEEEKNEKLANKERILQEKEDFFKTNKPYLVLKGKEAFQGYIGYIYPNAYVVLEKFFKNAKNTIIAEDAIYIMKVEEFLDLSVKSKPEIIENHLCQRVTHHRGWQGKVEDVLKKAITEDTIERVQIFENQIKSLKN